MSLFGGKKPGASGDDEQGGKRPGLIARLKAALSASSRGEAGKDASTDPPDPNDPTFADTPAQGASSGSLFSRLMGRGAKADESDGAATDASSAGAKKPLFSFLSSKDKDDDGASGSGRDSKRDSKRKPVKTIEHAGDNLLEVDGKKVAINLFWNTKQPEDKVKALASEFEDIGNFDIYSLFSMQRQVGFASSDEGYKGGQYIGVSLFPERMQAGTWFGAFPVDSDAGKFWVVAFRDGQVYLDAFFTDTDAAREAFDSEARAAGWDVIYAPDAWGVGGTSDTPLTELISLSNGQRLKYISPIRANLGRIVMTLIVILLVGGGAYYYYHTQEQARIAEEELERMRAEQARQAQADIPWRTYMDPQDFFEECQAVIETYTVFAPGWNQDNFSCSFERDSITVTTGWTRSGGRIAYLRSLMPDGAPQIFLDSTGNRVDIEIVEEIETTDLTNQVAPWSPQRLTRVLSERFQTMGLPINIDAVTAQVGGSRGRREEAPQATFNYHNLTFSTSVAVDEYFRLLSDVPAVIPDSLQFDHGSSTWHIVARAYHPPIGL